MRKALIVTASLCFMFCILSSNVNASTLTLAGPSFTGSTSGWGGSGLQFEALQDITLTGFRVDTRNVATSVRLTDLSGTTLETFSGPVDALASDLSWSLYQGETYRLLLDSDGGWTSSSFPVANDHIQVEGTYAGFTGYVDTNYWMFFNDITTTTDGAGSNAVPEPATMVLMGTGLLGMAFRKRKV